MALTPRPSRSIATLQRTQPLNTSKAAIEAKGVVGAQDTATR
jgi:hypothetical protein